MKPEWKAYLDSIGLGPVFQSRLEEVLKFFEEVHRDPLQDIFITEFLDKEGQPHYESVWIFSEHSAMEAKEFLVEDNFDWTPMAHGVRYWELKKSKFDFREARPESRMSIGFALVTGTTGELKASGRNCDYLKQIFVKHILANTIKDSRAGQLLGTPE